MFFICFISVLFYLFILHVLWHFWAVLFYSCPYLNENQIKAEISIYVTFIYYLWLIMSTFMLHFIFGAFLVGGIFNNFLV